MFAFGISSSLVPGTAVAVYGTLDQPDEAGGNTMISYSIDNSPPTTASQPSVVPSNATFQQLLFEVDNLSDGPHNLTMTMLNTHAFIIDFILYAPSASVVPEVQTIVDDADPNIVYTSHWARAGSQQEFNSTTHFSTVSGDKAIFTFNGKYRPSR